MAEEIFQGGVCGGNWWNSSINLFGPLPCSPTAVDDTVSFGWLNHPELMTDIRTVRSISDDSAGSASDGSSSVVLQDAQNPQHPMDDGNMPMTSTLQMMGICLSSSTTTDNWNLGLLDDSGRSVENYSHMLQESACLNSGTDYRQQTGFGGPQIHQDRSSKTLYEDSCIDSFTQMDPIFAQEQQPSPDSLIPSSTAESAATCQGLSVDCFPLNPASCGYNSTLLQTLFDADSQALQSLSDNRAANYPSSPNYQMNSAETLASLSKTYPEVKPSLPKQHPANHLQLTGNSMALATGNVLTTFLPSILPQVRPRSLNSEKPNLCSFGAKFQHQTEGPCDLASEAKKVSNEPALKRPRIEAPSPLPTFKVRKEKMGDRITALQQLVSPFGKTDTASVLHEAIEYVKFLHDQVRVLSAPYLRDGSPPLQHQQAADHKIKNQERLIQDLNSRGLCLVPISSTIPVAAEASNDFWPPTFGGSFR